MILGPGEESAGVSISHGQPVSPFGGAANAVMVGQRILHFFARTSCAELSQSIYSKPRVVAHGSYAPKSSPGKARNCR